MSMGNQSIQVRSRLEILRVETERVLKRVDRFLGFAEGGQGDAATVVIAGNVGPAIDGAGQESQCLLFLSELMRGQTEQV